jgi:hypothetical protein
MVFSLLKKLFKDSPQAKPRSPKSTPAKEERPVVKEFQYLICDDKEYRLPKDTWYRMEKWSRQNFLKMECDWSKDWKSVSKEEEVVGITRENRMDYFVLMFDQEDFKVSLERERDNPVDPNAIKVMGSATVEGELMTAQLGYLSKEMAERLKGEDELDARPRLAQLPYEDSYYGLNITVLVRTASYKKKMKKA